MPDAKTLLPVEKQPLLLLYALVMVFILGALFFLIMRRVLQEKPLPKERAALPPTGQTIIDVKNKYLKLIDDIYLRATSHAITERQSHQQLSVVLRDFIYEISLYPAHKKTLSELQNDRHARLSKIVEELYPYEFAHTTTEDIAHRSIERTIPEAKELVTSWS